MNNVSVKNVFVNNVIVNNVIVFDIDETLGFFQEINYLWQLIKNIISNVNSSEFFKLLDLYPEFLRPNILIILKYIKNAKINNKCTNVMIFTNNQTSTEWITLLVDYFNFKLKYILFDKIIGAFKIRGKLIELNRTSHIKKYNDFINCSKLPFDTKICFIDDKYYNTMENKNLIYIKIKPYIYEIPKDILFNRFYNNFTQFDSKININFIHRIENKFNYIFLNKNEDIQIHKILSKKILQYIKNFLINKPLNTTIKNLKKNTIINNNKTKKNIRN
jgi:hypothetical protein